MVQIKSSKNVKICPFRLLRDYYGDSLDVIFSQFPNHCLPLPQMFLRVTTIPQVFLLFPLSVSPVSYFRFLD